MHSSSLIRGLLIVVSIVVLIGSFSGSGWSAQAATDTIWRDADESRIVQRGIRQIIPAHYRLLAADESALLKVLGSAPAEGAATPLVLALPLPDGSLEHFQVWNAPIMEPVLAANFPAISTYIG